MEDHPDFIAVHTGYLSIRISRQHSTLSFSDKEGRILNEEDAGLGTSWIGEQVTSYRKLQEGERFIGLGEKTGPLDRRGHGYQNWNTDAFSYSLGEDPLYCSTPFYLGIQGGRQYGIFLDNTHKTFFNFGASNNRFSSFAADQGDQNYYFIQGNSVARILENYAFLTGRMPLPPKWSIGYQQCRYSYYPDTEVRTVARTFRDKGIPADGIVLDIHYMDQYKIFTWDNQNFPDPAGLIAYLRSLNFEVVLMCDPGIKVEKGYAPYDEGCKEDLFVKYPDGTYYTGQVWPGWCHFPDFTDPKARTWWAAKLADYASLGVQGFWNDMNEIATWGHMLPENIEFEHEGERTTARKARNLYGFQMARSTYEAARALLKGKRPFNLTRSGFSGVQRYAAVWTGDNVSYDDHMLLGVRMVNSLGLTGIPFVGYDVAGFTGEASVGLFARWITVGAFSPFFRGHTMVNSPNAEPWAYGEEVENIARNFIRFRYQLMPYLYSVFAEAARTGMPVQRSLAITHTHDPRVYQSAYQNQYFFGPYLLVAPVVSHQHFAKIFFPQGEWYSLYDGTRIKGDQEVIVESPLHRLPVYVQAGAILPLQPPVLHTREPLKELILHVYSGGQENTFDFYEDDGATFAFESGEYHSRRITHDGPAHCLTMDAIKGTYRSELATLRIILHGDMTVQQFTINGKKYAAKSARNAYFLPLEKYDPLHDPDTMGEEAVVEVSIAYTSEPIQITW
jgi:alpha-glucosidase